MSSSQNRTIDTVKKLLAKEHETEWLEFKRDWFEPHVLGEYISALSNSAAVAGEEYAYFIWGVDDKTHEAVGTAFDYDTDVSGEPLKHFLARQLSPSVNFTFENVSIDQQRLVLLTISAANSVPTAFGRERFIRIGSSKERLSKFPDREAHLFDVLKNGLPSIENTPSEYQDLTFEKLLIYYGAKGIELNRKTFEKNLGLRTKSGEYNVLAQLLSDDSHMPLRVGIFSGTSKADNMYSVREFGYQCLLYSLDDVLRYGDVLNIIQADEANRVVERDEQPLFENRAFREAVINAFIHNRWVSGIEPMITVYSDRIEILSRGKLPPGQTMEGFFAGESVPVNPRLAEIAMQLHISERTGRGVPTITKRYGAKAFEFRENSIVVTIPFNWINVMGDKVGEKRGVGTSSAAAPLKGAARTHARVLGAIRNNPHITIPQIAQELGLAKATVDKSIAALKREGALERVGSKKSGKWRVLEGMER